MFIHFVLGVDTRDLTHDLVSRFKRHFGEGRKLFVKPIRPKFNLEETDKWMVEIYDPKTMEPLTEKYCTPKQKKQVPNSFLNIFHLKLIF